MRNWRAVALVLIGVFAALFYSNFLLDVAFSTDHDWFAVVSELEVPGAQTATLLRTTDVLCGLLVLALLPSVWAALPVGGWRKWAVSMTAIFAITGAAAGIISLPCANEVSCSTAGDEVQRWMHDGLSIISQTTVFLGAVAIGLDTRHRGPRWVHLAAWITFWVGGVLGTIVFAYYGTTDSSSWQTGIAQRFQIGMTSAWIICLAVLAARPPVRVHRLEQRAA